MNPSTAQTLATLRRRLALRQVCAAAASRCELYTLTLPLPIAYDGLPWAAHLPRPFQLWARPDRRQYRIGLGRALHLEAKGEQRFTDIRQRFEQIQAGWRHDNHAHARYRPGAMCAFAFDPADTMSGPWEGIANSLLVIPEVLLDSDRDTAVLSLSCSRLALRNPARQIDQWLGQVALLLDALDSPAPPPDQALYRARSHPDNTDWHRLIARANQDIQAGQLAKVVPARHTRLHASREISSGAVLQQLAQQYPGCHIVGLSLGDKTLVAATPERLATLRDGVVSCDALGGTAARTGDPQHDGRLADQLLQDAKSRHEHALIVTHLRQTLQRFSHDLTIPSTPSIMPLASLQHLWSPLEARCASGTRLLDIVAALHPTPAVAGAPVAAAIEWLQRHESFARGWYTGAIGWLQADGDGDFAVLLRCALVQGRHADLYAGAGIVAGSDSHAELMETELKLAAVIGALNGEPFSTIGVAAHAAQR